MPRLVQALARLAAACLAPSPLGHRTPQTWTVPDERRSTPAWSLPDA